jgi:tetratricopeptide (TPR) repeat protein
MDDTAARPEGQAGEAASLARRLHDEGLIAFRRGSNDESAGLHDQAIAAATTADDDVLLSRMLAARSRPAFRAGDYALVQELNHRALQLAQSAKSVEAERLPLHMLSESLRAQQRYVEAIPLYERAIEHLRMEADSENLAVEEYNLGSVLVCAGRLEDGERLLRSSLAASRHGEGVDQIAYCVTGFGMLHALREDPGSAGRLFGCSDAYFERRDIVAYPAEQLERSVAELAARDAGADEFDAGYQRGRTESLMSVADEILAQRS